MVSNVSGATLVDGQAQGAITNDDIPGMSIDDVTLAEGNSGTTTFRFTVSLSIPAGPGDVTFNIATADGSATVADNDYAANSLTGQTIAAGASSCTFDVTVNGDGLVEDSETFVVNVTGVTGANVVDGQGQGTINNEDGPLTVTINQAALQADPTTRSPILFTAIFNRAVTGFDSAEVALSGSANPTVIMVTDSGDHMTYTIAVSGMTAYGGTITAITPAGAATDSGGNASIASTSTDNTVAYNLAGQPATAADHARAQAPLCAYLDGSTNLIIRANIPSGAVGGGSVFCRVIAENGNFRLSENSGEIGNSAVINRGVIQAVDVFGLMNSGTSQPHFNYAVEVCLQGSGAMLYLDANTAPRVLSELPVWTQGGYVCTVIPNAGTVILVSGSPSAVAPALGSSTALTDCMVKTCDTKRCGPATDSL